MSASGPGAESALSVRRKNSEPVKSWSECWVCLNVGGRRVAFSSPHEFAHHLRESHSTREGGSFLCRFGENGICSSLPLEGVSDKDYESHIAKHHIFPKRAQPRNTLGITGTSQRTRDGNCLEGNVRRQPNGGRKKTSRSSPFPAPAAGCDSVSSLKMNNALEAQAHSQQPNLLHDVESKEWTIYSSSQNLASVLNDPNIPRSHRETIFTKDWGSYFVDTASIPSSTFLPKISQSHFESYAKQVNKRNKSLNRFAQRSQALAAHHMYQLHPSRSLENVVPKIFMKNDFNLENVDTFRAVLSFGNQAELLATGGGKGSSKWNSVAKEAMKDLQKTLSDHLDLVEEHLSRQISLRFRDFFHIMNAMDTVMDQLTKTIKEVTIVRRKCSQLDKALVKPSLETVQLTHVRSNAYQVYEKLQLMSTVHQTQPTIQLLLRTSDYLGALDLINTSRDVVTQDLAGLKSFRHLKHQLSEVEKGIDMMMEDDFAKFIATEFNRPLEVNEDKYAVNEEDRLSAILLGMLRIQRFNFTDVFREEACTAIKSVVKQTAIEAVSLEDDIDVSNRLEGGLFDQLRCVEFPKWLALLNLEFENLFILLKRIEAVEEVILKTIYVAFGRKLQMGSTVDEDDAGEETKNKSAVSSDIFGSSSSNGMNILSRTDFERLRGVCKESLGAICDFAHSRCAQFVESRSKDGALDKLYPSEFTDLVKSIETFTFRCEKICGRRSPNLKLVLQTQANKFATRFHDEKKKKLNALLDIEQWKSLDSVPVEFQELVNQIIDGCKFTDLKRSRTQGQNNLNSDKGTPHVVIKEEKYVLVASVITLVNMLIDYCHCSCEIRALSPDLLTRLLDLMKQFNSRTCKLVLGGGAVQLAGLKTITARNLVNSGRGLQVVIAILPYVRSHFEEVLPSKQRSMTKHFDDILRLYREHVERIPGKLVQIIRESMIVDLAKWEARPPVPSPQFQAVSQHLNLLHNNVHEALPVKELVDLFSKIHDTFKDVLKAQLVQLKIVNDGGPQHGLVTQELTFYLQNLSRHEVAKFIKFSNDDLWTR